MLRSLVKTDAEYYFPLEGERLVDAVVSLCREGEGHVYDFKRSDGKPVIKGRHMVPPVNGDFRPSSLLYKRFYASECASAVSQNGSSVFMSNSSALYEDLFRSASDSFRHKVCWMDRKGDLEMMVSWLIGEGGVDSIDENKFAGYLRSWHDREPNNRFLAEVKQILPDLCWDLELDYTKMPQMFRDERLEADFLQKYPYLAGGRDDDLLDTAYRLGSVGGPTRMTLREEPSAANGYIGGEMRFNSYVPLVGVKQTALGKPTGLAFIDCKDCTNQYVIMDSDRKAVPFYSLGEKDRRRVLASVHFSDKVQREMQAKRDDRQARTVGNFLKM